MTDTATRQPVHPVTLRNLQGRLTSLRGLAGMAPSGEDEDADLLHAADETRENFPGLDDLTLAAVIAHFALAERDAAMMVMANGDLAASMTILTGAAAVAKIALTLAGDLGSLEDEPQNDRQDSAE